jgi:hypothetical protein
MNTFSNLLQMSAFPSLTKTPSSHFRTTLYVSTQAYTSRLTLHTWSRADCIAVRGSVNLPKNMFRCRLSEGMRKCLILHLNIMFFDEHCSLSDIYLLKSDIIQSCSTPVSVTVFPHSVRSVISFPDSFTTLPSA